jgi:serine/threonine protein phosphatase 1
MPFFDRLRSLIPFGSGGGPDPDRPLYLIGDIHGRADLLQQLFDMIDADQAARGHDHPLAVFVGDYVDRGPDSRSVLDTLMRLDASLAADPAAEGEMLCLMGNHERMMLDFLDDPLEAGPRWLAHGGVQTLDSFGIGGVPEEAGDEVLRLARDALAEALSDGVEDWLRGLPLIAQCGNVAIVHAAADPGRAIDDQLAHTLLWGHPAFLEQRRADGLWVAHGHTIVPRPAAARGRIALDTGAWSSGRLTAAILAPGEPVRFLST